MKSAQIRDRANRIAQQPRTQQTTNRYIRLSRRLGDLTPYEYARTHRASDAYYYQLKAAYQVTTAAKVLIELQRLDEARRRGEREAARAARSRAEQLLARLEEQSPDYDRQHLGQGIQRAYRAEPRKSRSKRAGAVAARRRVSDVLDALNSDADRALLLLVTVFGFRSAEIVRGIRVVAQDGKLTATVLGVKLSASGKVGQPERSYSIEPVSAEAVRLYRAVMALPAHRLAGAGLPNIAAVRAWSKRVTRAARKRGLKASPYSYRHAFASAAKAGGVDPVVLAAAMGHQGTRSQSAYGSAGGGKSGGLPDELRSASATISVRQTHNRRGAFHDNNPSPTSR